MSKETNGWTHEYASQQKMMDAYGATDEAAGRESGERLDGVPVMFNPTVEPGKVFALGVGKHGEELQLHCTEQTWQATKSNAQAMNANRELVRSVKAALNRRKCARILGIPNFG